LFYRRTRRIRPQIESHFKAYAESILNIRFNNIGWIQATLPTKSGGIGLRSGFQVSLAAFISSCKSSSRMVTPFFNGPFEDYALTQAFASWSDNVLLNSPLPTATAQKAWDTPLVLCLSTYVSTNAEPQELPRLRQVMGGAGYEFLEAFPSSNLDCLLSNEEIRVAICLRLGLDVVTEHICRHYTKRNANIPVIVNSKGHHALICKNSAGRSHRHRICNVIINKSLQRAGFSTTLEPTGLIRRDGKRPDGVTLRPPWRRGLQLIWDFSCSSEFAAKNNSPKFLEQCENQKINKYADITGPHEFIPIICGTLGGFGNRALVFFKLLGLKITDITLDKKESFYLRQRLSIAICRSNSLCILGSLPVDF
jgi:hypothetical protein